MLTRSEISARIDQMILADPLPRSVAPDYLSAALVSYPERGGKRLRPALLIWSCAAAGGDVEAAWPAALAVELYHNWTLIHDDIIDDDDQRRGKPTCHTLLAGEAARFADGGSERRRRVFGANMAILAGDVLHGWSIDALARGTAAGVEPAVNLALVRRMCSWLTPRLIAGEALDIEFELRQEVDSRQILEMMYLKTGALLQFCAEAGVMIGQGISRFDAPEVDSAGRFAAAAGVVFQIQDDLLGLFAETGTLGKPVGSDIAEGKHTLLIARTMEMASAPQKRELAGYLGTGSALGSEQLDRCRRIITACGARAAVETEAREIAEKAGELLVAGFAPSPARDRLAEWLQFLTRRSH